MAHFQVERILDKHSARFPCGAAFHLKEKDPITGLWLVKPGNFFEVGSSDTPSPKYLTWDGNLQAVQLGNRMADQPDVYAFGDGSGFSGGSAGQGEVNSGRHCGCA